VPNTSKTPAQQALGKNYPHNCVETLSQAAHVLREYGKVCVHAEPCGGPETENSVVRVTREQDLSGVIDEAFVNALALAPHGKEPYIWFSA